MTRKRKFRVTPAFLKAARRNVKKAHAAKLAATEARRNQLGDEAKGPAGAHNLREVPLSLPNGKEASIVPPPPKVVMSVEEYRELDLYRTLFHILKRLA